MTGRHQDDPRRPDLDGLIRLAQQTSQTRDLADDSRRRGSLYDALASHPNPLWREIGTQLRDGKLRPRDLLAVEAYRERMAQGLHDHGDEFPSAVAAARQRLATTTARTGPLGRKAADGPA